MQLSSRVKVSLYSKEGLQENSILLLLCLIERKVKDKTVLKSECLFILIMFLSFGVTLWLHLRDPTDLIFSVFYSQLFTPL